jgi:hypothetical protein
VSSSSLPCLKHFKDVLESLTVLFLQRSFASDIVFSKFTFLLAHYYHKTFFPHHYSIHISYHSRTFRPQTHLKFFNAALRLRQDVLHRAQNIRVLQSCRRSSLHLLRAYPSYSETDRRKTLSPHLTVIHLLLEIKIADENQRSECPHLSRRKHHSESRYCLCKETNQLFCKRKQNTAREKGNSYTFEKKYVILSSSPAFAASSIGNVVLTTEHYSPNLTPGTKYEDVFDNTTTPSSSDKENLPMSDVQSQWARLQLEEEEEERRKKLEEPVRKKKVKRSQLGGIGVERTLVEWVPDEESRDVGEKGTGLDVVVNEVGDEDYDGMEL